MMKETVRGKRKNRENRSVEDLHLCYRQLFTSSDNLYSLCECYFPIYVIYVFYACVDLSHCEQAHVYVCVCA